ncbi:MAG: cob(I)yrinic acid a,c-diamide adenosyltransferase [Acidobacteriota bacterium]
MVRITKVYTKQGDGGTTSLGGGQKVPKTNARIEAYGGVDELNATIGLVAESLRGDDRLEDLRQQLLRRQNELFDLGAQLAVLPEDRVEGFSIIGTSDIEQLEEEIDGMNESLEPLRSFILPGGGETSARLHLCRTVCRRVERDTLRLGSEEELDGTEVPYLNRLSDWFFVASRYAALRQGIEETLWVPGER